MTTVVLLALGYAAASAGFVCWVKNHAPEGYEDDEKGFIAIGEDASERPSPSGWAAAASKSAAGSRSAHLG